MRRPARRRPHPGGPRFATLTAGELVDLARRHCRRQGAATDYEVTLALRRGGDHKFVPTWYSALEHAGHSLDEAAAAELEAHRRRRAEYVAVQQGLCGEFAALTPVKGLAIADAYPKGIERYLADIDLVAAGEDTLWAAAQRLAADGWEGAGLALVRVDSARQYFLALTRSGPAFGIGPSAVELATVAWPGNGMGVPRRARVAVPPGRAGTALQVVGEGLSRTFGLRDHVDACALLHPVTAGELRALTTSAAELGVLGELAALLRGTAEAGLAAGVEAALPGRRRLAAERARRLRQALATLAGPRQGAALRWAQHRKLYSRLGRLGEVVWRREVPWPPEECLRRGLVLFGIPLPGAPRAGEGAVLRRDAPVLDTPVGPYLLTASGFVRPAGSPRGGGGGVAAG